MKEEALRIFRLADKDSDELLDLSELTIMRGRVDWAEELMKNVDADASGNFFVFKCWFLNVFKRPVKGFNYMDV